jgi:predicted transcriptional regulator
MDIKSAFDRMFNLSEFPRVRKTDPVTSHEAAESIKPVVSHHFQTILECLQTYGPLGKDGISAMTNLESNQVARRLNEMQKIGLIKLTGKTVKSDSGRSEREWTA